MSTADEFLFGGGGKSASFENIGDTVTGTIVSTEVQQQTDISDGKPLTWDNGDPRMQLVVRLQTTARDDDDDDGIRAVYVRGSKRAGSRSLHDAVASAVRASGAKGLEAGGTLTVTHTGTEPSATRGFNPRKLYSATYKPPSSEATTGGFLGTATPDTPPPAPVSVPQLSPEQAAMLAAWQKSQQQQPA